MALCWCKTQTQSRRFISRKRPLPPFAKPSEELSVLVMFHSMEEFFLEIHLIDLFCRIIQHAQFLPNQQDNERIFSEDSFDLVRISSYIHFFYFLSNDWMIDCFVRGCAIMTVHQRSHKWHQWICSSTWWHRDERFLQNTVWRILWKGVFRLGFIFFIQH